MRGEGAPWAGPGQLAAVQCGFAAGQVCALELVSRKISVLSSELGLSWDLSWQLFIMSEYKACLRTSSLSCCGTSLPIGCY